MPEREVQRGGVGEPRGREGPAVRRRVYLRFNVHQRLQHFLLAFSFLGLMLTGIPLRFPEIAVSRAFVALLGGVLAVGVIHRILGLVMTGAAAYHVVYLVAMYRRGHRGTPILFSRQDGRDFWDDLKYFVGQRKQRPRFGRYSWHEKFDYFGAVVGVLIMVATGLVIWWPQAITVIMPGWAVTAAVIIHDYEALLAGLAIFLWHFYWVHLRPEVYPMSMVWLTGQVTEEEMAQNHPLELEQLEERQGRTTEDATEVKP